MELISGSVNILLVLLCSITVLASAANSTTDTTTSAHKSCTSDSDCVGDPQAFCRSTRCECRQSAATENQTISAIWLADTGRIKCITAKRIGQECQHDQECNLSEQHSLCTKGICSAHSVTAAGDEKSDKSSKSKPETNTAVLPIMIVMGVMFAGMCVALNLFSRARFQNSRSVFNSSHPVKTGQKRPTRRQSSSVRAQHERHMSQYGQQRSPSDSIHSNNEPLAQSSRHHHGSVSGGEGGEAKGTESQRAETTVLISGTNN